MKPKYIISIVIIVVLALLIWLVPIIYNATTDINPSFPKQSQGMFLENPKATIENGIVTISWKTADKFEYNEIQYRVDKTDAVHGRSDAEVTETEYGYQVQIELNVPSVPATALQQNTYEYQVSSGNSYNQEDALISEVYEFAYE